VQRVILAIDCLCEIKMCNNFTLSCVKTGEMLEAKNSTSEDLINPEFEHPLLFILLAFFSLVTVAGNLLVSNLSCTLFGFMIYEFQPTIILICLYIYLNAILIKCL